jgi:hypothetical protein
MSSPSSPTKPKAMGPKGNRVSLKKLAQVEVEGGGHSQSVPESEMTSIFDSISEIQKAQNSFISSDEDVGLQKAISDYLRGTEKITDLIADGTTTLVYKELTIETSKADIYGRRYILYQKDNSEGQIKIGSSLNEEARSEADDSEAFTFHQCTFYLCETRQITSPSNIYLSAGIRIASERKIRFIDCAFIGINCSSIGQVSTGVNFVVFMDCFFKLNLELINCYFSSIKSVLLTNFSVRSLIIKQCTFECIDSDCMHITHPEKLFIGGCQFLSCVNQTINVKLFDEEHSDKNSNKRTSVFATATKIDHTGSMVGKLEPKEPFLAGPLDKESAKRILQRYEKVHDRKKYIVIKGNHFTNCDQCIRIKGMRKNSAALEDLDVSIEENIFDAIKTCCLFIESVHTGRFKTFKNSVVKCNGIAFKVFNCRASKEDMLFQKNVLNGIYHIGLQIDSSVIKLLNNEFLSCTAGAYIYLTSTASWNTNRDEIFDSHKDIILRDTIKDSFIGGTNNTPGMGNLSILAGGSGDAPPTNSFSRVILRGNNFKEISQYGVQIQNCSSSSIKIEACKFTNVKEPILISEKDIALSRNNTRNILPGDNSEMLAPSFCATPRQMTQSGKGTIVIKENIFEGGDLGVVKKFLNSYLYDIGNTVVQAKR